MIRFQFGLQAKRGIRNIVSVALVFSLALGFCGCNKTTKSNDATETKTVREFPKLESQTEDASNLTFHDYSAMIFNEDILTSRAMYIQLIQDPKDFGLQNKDVTPSRLTFEDFQHEIQVSKDRLAVLEKLDVSKLNQTEKVEYELLKEELERQISLEDCYYYQEPLSPLNGAQVALSSNLTLCAERFFENMKENNEQTAKKLDEYFLMYEDYGQYLQDIAVFEREKIKQGLGMKKNHAEEVIATIKKITDSDAADFTSEIIAQIQKADFFTMEEKVTLSDKAIQLAKEQIIPGFQAIQKELEKITTKTECFDNFSTTEEGKKYYRALLKKSISCNDTPEQVQAALKESFSSISVEFTELYQADPNLLSVLMQPLSQWTNTDDLIYNLVEKSKEDFPELDYTFDTKTMPQELNGVYGGLFFPPAIDTTVAEHYIYLGSLYKEATPQYIQIIAHEGAPGHLYQHEFMETQNLSPLYKLLYYQLTGYLEGWTTYIEQFGYEYAGYTKEQARALEISRLMDMYIASYVDIGTNYFGWDDDKVIQEVKSMVPLDDNTIKSIIDQAQKTPTLFQSYAMGYIKMNQLKRALEEKRNTTLTSKEFHELYYSVPPATYDILFRELGL